MDRSAGRSLRETASTRPVQIKKKNGSDERSKGLSSEGLDERPLLRAANRSGAASVCGRNSITKRQISGWNDGGFVDNVALTHQLKVFEPFRHFAEHRVAHVEVRGSAQGEIELTGGAVGIGGAGHGHDAGRIVFELRGHFQRNRVFGTAHAGAERIAALDNEAGLVAMKVQSIIEAALNKRDKVSGGQRRQLFEQFKLDGAFRWYPSVYSG